jgi:hypothetical protein
MLPLCADERVTGYSELSSPGIRLESSQAGETSGGPTNRPRSAYMISAEVK